MNKRNNNTKLYVVGLSFQKANQEIRSKYSITNDDIPNLLNDAKKKGIDSLVILSTCNRTEIFGFVEHPYVIIELLCKHSKGLIDDLMKYVYVYKQEEAVTHLFEVAAGIKSQILGDYEIISQLKNAVKQSKKHGLLDGNMDRLLNYVMQSSKEIKNSTEISQGTTSTSYAGIQYLKEKFDSLEKKKIAILGIGDIGKSTIKNLITYSNSKNITVLNRTESKVEEFIKSYNTVKIGDYTNIKEELEKQDILFVCSSATAPIITKDNLPRKKEFTIVDLSLPSNVDSRVKEISSIDLIQLDDLSSVTDNTLEVRKKEIPKAQKIIAYHKEEYRKWISHRKFTPVINGLRETLKNIQDSEVKTATKNNPEFEEIAKLVSEKIIQKITNRFAHHLKNEPQMANQSIEVIKGVFNIT
jgi:glutamyl-tRNA reductase